MGSCHTIGGGNGAARMAAVLLLAGCAAMPPSPERGEAVVTPGPSAAERASQPPADHAAARPAPLTEDVLPRPIAGAVEFVMASRQIPGCVVALFAADGVVRVQSFGLRDVDKRLPMTRDTLFPVGSITRAFTVAAIATLVDEGKLRWESTLGETLPSDLRLPDPVRALTLRQLASHTAGLPPQPGNWRDDDPALAAPPRYGLRDLIDALRTVEFVVEPSTFFHYSNFGSALLGIVLERASNRVYADAVRHLVFDRVGMDESGIEPTAAQRDRLAVGYTWNAGRLAAHPRTPLGEFSCVGGAFSCVDDLARLVTVHAGEGGPWSAETLADLRRPVVRVPGLADRQAATGWFVETLPRFGPLLASVGELDGVSAVVAADLDSASFLVVLANSGNSSAEKIARAVLDKIDDTSGVWRY
jgi:CubicO group peptidase (beta-lactamase class C family)